MEITKNNFSDKLLNITNDLKRSSFVGFDAEFTAILSGECFKHRLFDTNAERYDRMKSEVNEMIMTQVGLTMFCYDRNSEGYEATSYTFHLCPQSFGGVDQSFVFQASTLKFLCRHNFDFNKFTYQGLNYLSKYEEMLVRQQLKDKTLLNSVMQKLEIEDEKLIQDFCSQVSVWLTNSEDGTLYLDVQDPVIRYIVHNEIRHRFPDLLTTDSLGNSNKILIYRNLNVEGANSASMAILEENLMNHLLGFSRVIALLDEHKKPLVGHNLFLDLLLMHNQFIGPLPHKYWAFKRNINAMFPIIFDTKYISHEMAKKLSLDDVWKSNALQTLYEFFADGKCKKIQNGINLIRLSIPFGEKQSYHEAGWDSYCSGYCLVKLGQWAAGERRGVDHAAAGPAEMRAALTEYANKINVIRAAVPCMNLVEDDPPRHRPGLLHVRALAENAINVAKVASVLSSFGAVDIKLCSGRTALVAAGTQRTVDKILNQMKNSREYKITKYNVHRHSLTGRLAIWSSAFITGSLVLFFIHNKVK